MNSMKKSALAAALSAGLIGGGAAGVILGGTGVSGAQETTTTVVAESTEERPEPGERLAEVLAPLVEDGTIDQAQADAVIAALQEAAPRGGDGFGGRGPGGHERRGTGLGSGVVADALGMEEGALREALRDGQTLAEVAEAQGVDVQVVIDAAVAELSTRLDEKVAEGDLTQEEADERLAEATERITERIDDPMPRGPRDGGPDQED